MKEVDKLNAQRIFRENTQKALSGDYYTLDNIEEMFDKCLKYIETRKKQSKRETPEIINIPGTLDLECTSTKIENVKYAWEYIYIIGINGCVLIVRTPDEFIEAMDKISKKLNLSENRVLRLYVHNLSYDFQFLRSKLDVVDYFAREKSQPIYVTTSNGFQLYDSLILTGYKLETTAEHLTEFPEITKKTGDLDYEKIRHYKTKLSKEEMQYCINDALVVMCDIYTRMKDEGWNIAKIPMTKTGYVRRIVKQACLEGKLPGEKTPPVEERNKVWSEFKSQVGPLTLTVNEYNLARDAFCGGFTHGSPLYIDERVDDVSSFDFTSAYPAAMIAFLYPMSKGRKVKVRTQAEMEAYIKKYCCVFRVTLKNVESKYCFDSYLSKSKCEVSKDCECHNGRIYKAEEVTVALTDVDWWVVVRSYNFTEIAFHDFYIYKRGYLPTNFVKSILYFYKQKTELKNVEGCEKEYQYCKELLNSSYGMTAQAIDNKIIYYIPDNPQKDVWDDKEPNLSEVIKKYNTKKDRFISYLWSLFCTSYNRRNLWTAIMSIGDDYVYSDTDSVKICNKDDHKDYFDIYNKWITEKLEKAMEFHGIDKSEIRPKTKEGKEKPLGVWDYEGDYTSFKTLGAKRYIYTSWDKNKETNQLEHNLHITVSGVDKNKGANYLLKRYKTFDNVFDAFTEKLVFPAEYELEDGKKIDGCGKLTHTYIDKPFTIEVTDDDGVTCVISQKTYCHLEKTSYSLSDISAFISACLEIKEEKGGI